MADNMDIKLSMKYGGHGEMLEEVVRACMHSMNPSCLVRHVLMGIAKYRREVGSDKETLVQRILHGNLDYRLRLAEDDLRKREDTLYSEDDRG